MKLTPEKVVIGGILLWWLLLRNKSGSNSAPIQQPASPRSNPSVPLPTRPTVPGTQAGGSAPTITGTGEYCYNVVI